MTMTVEVAVGDWTAVCSGTPYPVEPGYRDSRWAADVDLVEAWHLDEAATPPDPVVDRLLSAAEEMIATEGRSWAHRDPTED